MLRVAAASHEPVPLKWAGRPIGQDVVPMCWTPDWEIATELPGPGPRYSGFGDTGGWSGLGVPSALHMQPDGGMQSMDGEHAQAVQYPPRPRLGKNRPGSGLLRPESNHLESTTMVCARHL